MALQQTFTGSDDNTGNYWKVVLSNFDQHAKKGRVVLYCFKDKASSDAGKAPIVGGVREYRIQGQEFVDFFSDVALKPQDRSVIERSYVAVKGRREVTKSGFQKINGKYWADADVTNGVPNGGATEVDVDTAAESFFDSAIDVLE
jgi:hypothetical protein